LFLKKKTKEQGKQIAKEEEKQTQKKLFRY